MASSIVNSAAQQLGNLLVEEAKSLYKLRDKVENLQTELAWMECFLRDADNRQHQEKVVCMWVSQVRDLAYDAEDLIETYLHEVPLHRRDGIRNTLKWFSCILWTCDAWTLRNLGSEIDNLTVKLSELTKRLRRYGIEIIRPTRSLEYNTLIWEDRRTYSHIEEDVVGLEKDIEVVVNKLLNTEVKVVGISGVGGLGKTTLARKVFKSEAIKQHFNNNCVWIYISKEFDSKDIFQEISSQLEKGDQGTTVQSAAGESNNDAKRKPKESSAGEISKVLQEKRCLVVVDDIWTVKSWERLKPAFESILGVGSSSSSKILLTTRNQDLLQHVDPFGHPHLLQPLSDEESWELLKQRAFIGHGNTDAFKKKELGRGMLKHCKGLPIAIVALGGVLSTKKTTSEWEGVGKNISSYLMGGIEQGGGEDGNSTLKVYLELSYHDLPFYLKPCFLYLGNFPEDCTISTERLYNLWEAEGLLTTEGEAKKRGGISYDVGERYLNELVQRSMVQVEEWWTSGRIKTCHVHDVMRDMCLIKCEEVSFLHHIKCTASSPDLASTMPVLSNEIKKLHRCALYDENGVWLGNEIKKLKNGERVARGLRSLLVFQKMKKGTLQNIRRPFPLLRILDLEGADIDSVDGVERLIHLRYLSLRKLLRVKVLPLRLYDLKYLETLDLGGCEEIKLFNEFHKMNRLRHLYLPRDFEVYLPRGFEVEGEKNSKLSFPRGGQMETIKNFNPDRCETDELKEMTNLRVFSIESWYTFRRAEELKRVLEAPVMKKAGQLINNLRLQIDLNDVIKENTTERKRSLSPRTCTPPMGDLLLALENLPTLHVLRLNVGRFGEGEIKMSLSPRSFPNLTEFSVHSYERSFEWVVGEAAIPNLQVLRLNKCENLNNIPNSLKTMVLRDCVITEEVVSELGKLPHLNFLTLSYERLVIVNKSMRFSVGSFPKLTTLNISGLTELEEWEFGVGEGALANLQLLDLRLLNELKNVMITFPNLADVELGEGKVPALERLPHLKSLTIFKGLERKLLSFSACSFPELTILRLLRATALEEWKVGEGALANLRSLTLEGWTNFKEWKVGEGTLANLRSLKLEGWTNLKDWGAVVNKLPDSLIKVKLKDCENGEGGVFLFVWLEKLPSIQKLTIDNLIRSGGGNKLSFHSGTFLQLAELDLKLHSEGEEWEVVDDALPNLQLLTLRDWKRRNKLNKLPHRLTQVYLWDCEIGEAVEDDLLRALENHACLKELHIKRGGGGKKMSFSPGSFLHLTKLSIFWLRELEKLEVGDGALPHLQNLQLRGCYELKKLPKRGLPASVDIECVDPCIKGIEKYNTCPYFKRDSRVKSACGSKPISWLHHSCA